MRLNEMAICNGRQENKKVVSCNCSIYSLLTVVRADFQVRWGLSHEIYIWEQDSSERFWSFTRKAEEPAAEPGVEEEDGLLHCLQLPDG